MFVDTPGVHKPRHGLGARLVQAARAAVEEMDLILFIADAASPVLTSDRAVAEMLQGAACPVWLVINKVDAVGHDGLAAITSELQALYPFADNRFVSARRGDNVRQLLSDIAAMMPEGPMYYPPDVVVDRPEEFIVGEIVREKLIEATRDEVPHSLAVVVESMREREDREIVDIDASIIVERDSQKGIVIGAGGRVLRDVGTSAREEIQRLLGSQVNLQLWVKVRPRWRDDDSMLNRLGYRE
ncbi:MAG: GTPase Era [Firmicutes bacterium ADurb.Bin506]|nr:MAG: GTPase Era [Firmicutes bacterium ADurb.Bin506]